MALPLLHQSGFLFIPENEVLGTRTYLFMLLFSRDKNTSETIVQNIFSQVVSKLLDRDFSLLKRSPLFEVVSPKLLYHAGTMPKNRKKKQAKKSRLFLKTKF